MNKRVLEVTHATMRFGGLVAGHDLSMHIDSQEIVALIGPNGAGKTTLIQRDNRNSSCLSGRRK